MTQRIAVFDTTLRDGAQREGISFSADDKLRIVQKLDELGVDYIEGGWPGSNPKDVEFFTKVRLLQLKHARIATFGSTRRAQITVEEDPNIAALLATETPVAVIVGKSWAKQVAEVLRTTLDENLSMIRETVAYLKAHGREVLFDAEHYFDGYSEDAEYALRTVRAAAEAGADCAVLCDTNGGTLPTEMARIVAATVKQTPSIAIGIHCHNDAGVADANTLVAIEAGATHIQGTINGYGERCGNANLCTIIPSLQLKMGYAALPENHLELLTETSHYISGIANLRPDEHAPYVGHSAFAHKAGFHVNALLKNVDSYQHVAPELLGNKMRVLVSELSGRSNISHKVSELGLDRMVDDDSLGQLAQTIKTQESKGFQYEGAEGSFELLVRRAQPGYKAPFTVLDFLILVEKRQGIDILAEATVKARVNGTIMHTAADGNGPVNALDNAMRKALLPLYPELDVVHLTDYKVRIIDEKQATGARTRVLIDASDGETSWTTIGCSGNIIEASIQALVDSLELPLLRRVS